ncbi:AAA family ATPase [Clostridium chromiireducens]|uniref:AAA family ATPase n=1 Tax=Clostridium chromiireducens TaxID=225345 RepID=A0A399IQN2_9CLOT|nr:AAA family ATPase [Clostridium chromiireducens]RII33216.1 AAA family ATPase [Clostridium chromiireducens]
MNFKPLPIGIDNFEMLITRGYYFVDKTLLIKDLIDNKAAVNLFTRPRRFGKTLNMSMLQYFFENGEKDNSYLFEGLNIMKAGEKYLSHIGQYPVINLSLKSAKQPTFELALKCIKDELVDEFRRHDYVLEGTKLNDEKEKYLRITKAEDEDSLYVTALKFLSQCLEKYHEKKVIILIDEYDVPLENAFFEGFYDKMIAFIISLFESALKTNSSLEFSVITGCLRISRESIFTGLNNLEIISILNKSYDEYFGFTQNEVNKMLGDYELNEKETLVKEWYNGYIFGNAEVYNPWSAVRFVKDLVVDKNVFTSSYWANTSSNSIVNSLIEKADTKTKQEIEILIEGKTIEKLVHEDITYDEIYDSMDNLWNFMFFTGYFKKVSERMDEEDNRYIELSIPNREVKYIFRTKILKWFEERVKAKELSILYTAILNKDSETFQKELSKILRETISFNDAYENFYHGFVVGVLANMHDHIVKSNRESGDGRSDIYIKSPSIFDPAVIMELKVCKEPKDIYKMCDEALAQIEKNKYDDELRQEGYENIIKYGISFYKKDCIIKLG